MNLRDVVILLFMLTILGLFIAYTTMKVLKRDNPMKKSNKPFEQLFQLNPVAILLIDSKGALKKANPEAIRLFHTMEQELESYAELLNVEVKHALQTKTELRDYEMTCICGSKRIFLSVNVHYMLINNESHVLLFLRDNTTNKYKLDELEFIAYYDPLTQLPNRLYFQDKLDAAIQHAIQLQGSLMVMLVDLDELKLLNHTSGHLIGDTALQQVARILRDIVADRGVAARMSGDEFILYVNPSPSKQDVQADIQYIQEEFARCMANFRLAPVSLSIGYSFFPSDGADAQALINVADHAMLTMKRNKI